MDSVMVLGTGLIAGATHLVTGDMSATEALAERSVGVMLVAIGLLGLRSALRVKVQRSPAALRRLMYASSLATLIVGVAWLALPWLGFGART